MEEQQKTTPTTADKKQASGPDIKNTNAYK